MFCRAATATMPICIMKGLLLSKQGSYPTEGQGSKPTDGDHPDVGMEDGQNEKDSVVGTWHDNSYMEPVYGGRYHFYYDGNYLFGTQ